MRGVLLLLLLAACAPEVDDTGDEVEVVDTTDPYACDEGYRITWNGTESPAVGDVWTTVMLRCGDTPELGPYVIRTDPTDMATIEQTTLTWMKEGSGTLRVQVGALRETMDVTVAAP